MPPRIDQGMRRCPITVWSPCGSSSFPKDRPRCASTSCSASSAGTDAVSIEHVVMAFVVAPPRTVGVPREHRHLPDEPIRRRRGARRDDGPVVVDPSHGVRCGRRFRIGPIAEVDRDEPPRPERLRDRDERPVDRVGAREVAQRVPDRDDRVGARDRIVGERQEADLLCAGRVLARQVEHRRRRVGGEHPVAGVDEMLRQQAAAAAELEDEAVAFPYRLEQRQDPGRAPFGVEAEPEVVDAREIGSVVGGAVGTHTRIVPSVRTGVDGCGRASSLDGRTLLTKHHRSSEGDA